ncbi:MAG: hypothetical protein U0176_00265 [Bacteroidia bacterium]
MSQLNDDSYQIGFSGGLHTVTWSPNGPSSPATFPTGMLDFPETVNTLVDFTFVDNDNETLPPFKVTFNGTEGDVIFTLSTPSSWSTSATNPNLFECDGVSLGFVTQDGGIQIVGTVDIGSAGDIG